MDVTDPPTSARRRWRHRVAAQRRLLLVGVAALGIAVTPLSLPSMGPMDRRVRIRASMAGFAPAVVRVNRGDRVTVELVSTDVVHGLHLDGYGLSVTADPGQPATLTFVAGRSGTFRFRCSVTCGSLHPFLMGRLQVESNGLLWRTMAIAGLIAAAAIARARR